MLEDMLIVMIYAAPMMLLISLAGVLTWICEKVPFLNRLLDDIIDRMTLCDEYYYYEDEEEEDY